MRLNTYTINETHCTPYSTASREALREQARIILRQLSAVNACAIVEEDYTTIQIKVYRGEDCAIFRAHDPYDLINKLSIMLEAVLSSRYRRPKFDRGTE